MRFQLTIITLVVALFALTVAHEIQVEVEWKHSDEYIRIDDRLTVRDLAKKACEEHSIPYREGTTKIGAHFLHNYDLNKQIAAAGIHHGSRLHLRIHGFLDDLAEHIIPGPSD